MEQQPHSAYERTTAKQKRKQDAWCLFMAQIQFSLMNKKDWTSITFTSTSADMATGNLVNLEKTSEVPQIKDEFIASYSKRNF